MSHRTIVAVRGLLLASVAALAALPAHAQDQEQVAAEANAQEEQA